MKTELAPILVIFPEAGEDLVP